MIVDVLFVTSCTLLCHMGEECQMTERLKEIFTNQCQVPMVGCRCGQDHIDSEDLQLTEGDKHTRPGILHRGSAEWWQTHWF